MKSAYISYISALLLFGSNGIIASFIDLSSTDIVLYRTGIGTAILFVLFLITKKQWTFYGHKREFLFLLLSGVSMGASWMFLYEAYQQIGVSISSLLYYCGPVIVMILSPVIFKEKLLPRKITGFLSVLAGMILINGALLTNGHNFSGFFCGIMSACTYATMIIFNKTLDRVFENRTFCDIYTEFCSKIMFSIYITKIEKIFKNIIFKI